MNYMGYVETSAPQMRSLQTETADLFMTIAADGVPAGSYALSEEQDVWTAIRGFFQQQAVNGE